MANLKRDVLDESIKDINKALEGKPSQKEYLVLKALILDYSNNLTESQKILATLKGEGIAYESDYEKLKTSNPKYYPCKLLHLVITL